LAHRVCPSRPQRPGRITTWPSSLTSFGGMLLSLPPKTC
jgi:hypothetical protein